MDNLDFLNSQNQQKKLKEEIKYSPSMFQEKNDFVEMASLPRTLNDDSLTESQMNFADNVFMAVRKKLRALCFAVKQNIVYFYYVCEGKLFFEGAAKDDEEAKLQLTSLKFTEAIYYSEISVTVKEERFLVEATIVDKV